jgi:hypothetical protein
MQNSCLSLAVWATSLLRLFPSRRTYNLLCKQLGRAASSTLSQTPPMPTNPKNVASHSPRVPSRALQHTVDVKALVSEHKVRNVPATGQIA